jgi:carboxymethylenebutenolidase
MSESVQIEAVGGGRFAAYLAVPDQPRSPGLILIHYICGVNRMMRQIADGFAREGFLTIVPDLFWRQKPGVQLNNDPAHPSQEETALALKLNSDFNDEAGIEDLKVCLRWLRADDRCTGRAGVLGYCLGGRMAYLMAARSDADVCVGYYGVDIKRHLEESNQVRQQLMLHFASNDEHCLADERNRIYAALEHKPNVKLWTYDGARHQFALSGSRTFDKDAAVQADQRSIAFLNKWLESMRPATPEAR